MTWGDVLMQMICAAVGFLLAAKIQPKHWRIVGRACSAYWLATLGICRLSVIQDQPTKLVLVASGSLAAGVLAMICVKAERAKHLEQVRKWSQK